MRGTIILDEIEKDIATLCRLQTTAGTFLGEYLDPRKNQYCQESILFFTGLILSTLNTASKILTATPALTATIQQCVTALLKERSDTGTWNFYPRAERRNVFPDDADDTSVISHSLQLCGVRTANQQTIASLLTPGGFKTWFDDALLSKDVDPLVNMHISLYLNERYPQTISLLRDYISQKKDSPWYESYVVGLFFISRAIAYAPHLFSELRPAVANQLHALLKEKQSGFNLILIHYIATVCDIHVEAISASGTGNMLENKYYVGNKHLKNTPASWGSDALTQAIMCEIKIILYKKYLQNADQYKG